MKKLLSFAVALLFINFINAQNIGDTIKVKAFKYKSLSRDTIIPFPSNPSLTFEKIILKYNMRCKNGLISTGSNRNLGCGEWDYSCNTYVVDDSKAEKVAGIQKDYVVSNFTGTSYPYTSQQTFNYFDFIQKNVAVNSSNSITLHDVGSNNLSITNLLKTNFKTGRNQVLLTVAELTAAGLTAGNINAITLNVTNSGGLAKFFKVQMKNSSLTTLQAKNADFSGLTEVFFRDYTFVNGANIIQFFTPFNWDGTSSILVDISFSNTTNNTQIEFQGYTNTDNRTLTASNVYSADLSFAGLVDLNNQFLNTINNEISVSFWAKGDADLMPANNSILCGSSDVNLGLRQFNIHLPYDTNIYFDCGNVNNSYDRINKQYGNLSVIEGVWNHWTFTKNATNGSMKIYLNGILWHSGTGKTKVISLIKLVLGRIPFEFGSNYKGKIKELTIWNTELNAQNILDWKNKTIDATHPNYSSLVGYYKFNEGNGQVVTDSKNNITSTGENLKWDYERGNQLTTTFTESNEVPKITFHKGTYDLTVVDVVERYSQPKIARTVQNFSITSNEGVIPVVDDTINLLSTNNYFDAIPENVYTGDSGIVSTTIPVATEGTVTSTDLNYTKRFPFYNELVSFVTPYGIGLDLGINGKSWYFDMSDYEKILRGNKRIVMTLGGERQENMDLEFQFIVGTPPRNIVQFDQIWQGTNRTGLLPINGIINGTSIAPNNFTFNPNATSFKLKSSITGHGPEGEFGQNGGIISHRIRINDVQKFAWPITQLCAENPIFPQGGTWIYDRQGWCPGQRSLLKEQDLTPHVTAGTTMEIKYLTSSPGASGDYRYQVSHQIVGYSAPNFSNDAALVTIKKPNNSNAEFSRVNPMCEKPIITVRNTGGNAITSINFEYWLNEASTHQTFNWTGTLASMADVDIILPINTLWSNGIQSTGNKFNSKIMLVNGSQDQYANNNVMVSPITLPDVVPNTFKISLKTNNSPTQNSYTLYDAEGNTIESKTFPTANTVYTFTYQAPQIASGCYRLRVNDAGKDGLQWFANAAQGSGYVKLLNANDVVLKTFNPDFGGGFDYFFSVDSLLANEYFEAQEEIKVYPNPSKGSFSIEGTNLIDSKIKIYDILGNLIQQVDAENNLIEFNKINLCTGVYFINIEKNNKTKTKKLIIN